MSCANTKYLQAATLSWISDQVNGIREDTCEMSTCILKAFKLAECTVWTIGSCKEIPHEIQDSLISSISLLDRNFLVMNFNKLHKEVYFDIENIKPQIVLSRVKGIRNRILDIQEEFQFIQSHIPNALDNVFHFIEANSQFLTEEMFTTVVNSVIEAKKSLQEDSYCLISGLDLINDGVKALYRKLQNDFSRISEKID